MHRRILLVEHQANNLEPLSRLLRLHGYRVRTATTLEQGRRLAESETFDVVVSDVALPDGSGMDLLHEVRARRPVAGIAVDHNVDDLSVKHCTDAGFSTCLGKPLLFSELVNAIRQL